MKNLSINVPTKAQSSMISNFESREIMTSLSLQQSANAYLDILVTFGGIKIFSIIDIEKADSSTISNSEFSSKMTSLRCKQSQNEYDEIILMFNGILASEMSRSALIRISKLSLFSSVLPSKY